jgi:RND family efflux transporter MFP subunit
MLIPALGLLLLGCRRAGPPPEEPPPRAPVKIEPARSLRPAEWGELLGTTQPVLGRVARISAPVEGRVQELLLHGADGKSLVEGQRVHKGDVVAQLDTRVLVQQKKQAEIAKKRADIQVKSLEELRNRNTSPGFPLVTPIDLDRARLDLEEAASKVQGLDEQLKLYMLRAPIDGRLGRIEVMPGQTLSVGATVADVLDIDAEIDVLCFVPPHLAGVLKLKDAAQLGGLGEQEPAGKAADVEGTIEYIAEQAEAETGSFAVKVRFPNRDLRLRANAVVRVRVQTKPEKECSTIKETALQEDQDPPAVVIIEDKHTENIEDKDVVVGTARKLQADVGIRDRVLGVVEIRGLKDPDKPKEHFAVDKVEFIVEKGQGLKTGDPVRVEAEEED